MAEDEKRDSQTPDDTDSTVNQQVVKKEIFTSPVNIASKMQSEMPILDELINLKSPSKTKEKFENYTSDRRIMRRIVAEDPNYNLTIVPTLVDLCLKQCIENFEYNPIPFMYLNEKQKRQLLDCLPTNLSLKVTSHIIDDDLYWTRCCYAKWSIIDITYYDGSWKRAYFERFLEEIIETFVPGTTYTPHLHECVNYAAPYVQRLNIRQLLPPLKQKNKQKKLDDDSGTESESEQSNLSIQMDHLDLSPILEKLSNLKELNITYTVKDCGMNFEWSLYQFTLNDCLNLSKSIQQHSNLKVLNLINSHVSSEQCRLLATHLQNHSTLECLDLSHNSIGYRGIRALSKLLTGKCQLKSLNLTNNHLKSTSGLALAYALSQSDCLLVQLNLRMNKLQDDGGIALAKALIQNSTLKELNLAVNDLHENTATYFGHALTQNNTLTHLDLSNNQIGVAGSKKLQDGIDQNSSLIHLDLRFTGSSQEAEYAISQRIEMNQAMTCKLQQEFFDTHQCIPCEITSVARQQRPIVELCGEIPFTSLRI
ncbi:unnamed protein product [Schistosoma rodhaini]|uniref:T-complex-associated testis-expressed protein 1 n=2 Tax=Schistosoma rodhaini TaxID=6188 RepID=A0AA85FEQ2_9TREM|nr:unnamed protein product [Schistosoma rodhaini]